MKVIGARRVPGRKFVPAAACALAVIALFGIGLASSAGALTGHNTVFSDDIKNGQVKSPDIRDRTITSKDVAKATFQRAGTHHAVTLFEDQASGTIVTNGSGQGATDAWNDFLVYDNAGFTGTPVATDVGYDVTETGGQYVETVTFHFEDGDLLMTGIWNTPPGPGTASGVLAIVGGTGAYAGARGTASASLPSPYVVDTYVLDYTTP
jgi:hypothetical protein